MAITPPRLLTSLRFWDPETGLAPASDILLKGGRIAGIERAGTAGAAEGMARIDCTGQFAVPGLINGHHHSHEAHFRGRGEAQCLEEWMTGVRPQRPLALTPDDVRVRVLSIAAEALRSGTTTICDDVGIDPNARPDLLDAAAAAWEEAGIAAHVGPTMFNVGFARAVPFAEDMLPAMPAPPLADATAQVAALAGFAAGLARAGGRVRAIVAPSAPQRCTPKFLAILGDLAARDGLPMMMHALETRVQAVGARRQWPGGLIAYLDNLRVLRAGTALIHGVWLTRAEMAVLAERGASVQMNPASNLKLGSGVADMAGLLAAGVNVSLGSDGCGSIETVGMGGTLAMAALLSTLRGRPEQWLRAEDALRAATAGGAHALGREGEIGRIASGAFADIALYRLDRAPFIPLGDPVRQLVFGQAVPHRVLISGRDVLRDGVPLLIDEAAVGAAMARVQARLAPELDAAERAAAALRPGMRAIRERCRAEPLGPEYDGLRLDAME